MNKRTDLVVVVVENVIFASKMKKNVLATCCYCRESIHIHRHIVPWHSHLNFFFFFFFLIEVIKQQQVVFVEIFVFRRPKARNKKKYLFVPLFFIQINELSFKLKSLHSSRNLHHHHQSIMVVVLYLYNKHIPPLLPPYIITDHGYDDDDDDEDHVDRRRRSS